MNYDPPVPSTEQLQARCAELEARLADMIRLADPAQSARGHELLTAAKAVLAAEDPPDRDATVIGERPGDRLKIGDRVTVIGQYQPAGFTPRWGAMIRLAGGSTMGCALDRLGIDETPRERSETPPRETLPPGARRLRTVTICRCRHCQKVIDKDTDAIWVRGPGGAALYHPTCYEAHDQT